MQHLDLKLLGAPKITLDGKPIDTDRHKAIGLLAYLAVEGKAHSREALAALLWPDYPHVSAFSYLRRTIWELNKQLGKGWIESDRKNVNLRRDPGLSIDVVELQQVCDRPAKDIDQIKSAIGLYRGDFLEGLVVADTAPFEEWLTLQREAMRQKFGQALGQYVDALEEQGSYEEALANAQRWLSLDRLNEKAYRAAMRQMARMGDRNGVIRIFAACAKVLKAELDVTPEPETEDLYHQLVQRKEKEPERQEQTKKSTQLPVKTEGNLPVPSTSFIGREDEIEIVSRLALDPQVRLLTLVGPGGTGKTRLSIQVAGGMDGNFPDGTWFIPLAAVQSSQGIISAIAKGINFPFYKGEESPSEQLLDYLREKRMFIVLDNFEHLMDGGRELVSDILSTASNVKVLITSRERLSLQAEQIYRVHGLRLPEFGFLTSASNPEEQVKNYSAIELLEERAKQVKPEFEINKTNLKPLIDICQLVDGSPLGIELAAAWLEVLPEEEIASEIVRSLDFLQSTTVDTPERQRSLRIVFDTSWKLLDDEERQAFMRLCVFRGSFSRQAAQAVSEASIRTLLCLANKSWLEQSADGRYHLHEVLKQYGIERLRDDPDEWQSTKERQAEYYCSLVEIQGQALLTAQQIEALQAIKVELESNIPDAWDWLVGKNSIQELIDRMLPGLFHYWLIRGPSRDFLPQLKNARKSISSARNRKGLVRQVILDIVELYSEVNLDFLQNRAKDRLLKLWAKVNERGLQNEINFWYIVLVTGYGNIQDFQEASRRIADIVKSIKSGEETWDVGNTYLLAGWFTDFSQLTLREQYFHTALNIFRNLGVLQEQGSTLHALGDLASSRMDYESAIEHTLAAQSFYMQVGDPIGIDATWTSLGEYYLYLGKIDEAFHAFEELRHYSERTGNRRFLGTDLGWESIVVSRYGKLELALELRLRSLEIAREVGSENVLAWAQWELGEIYRLMGNIELAKKYYRAALPDFESMQELIGLGFYYRGLGDIAMTQGDWTEALKRYNQALTYHEQELRSNRNWGLALILARLGVLLVKLGSLDEARQKLKLSLERAVSCVNPDLKALPLAGIADWLLAKRENRKAVELAACVASKATTWNEVKEQARAILLAAKKGFSPEQARYLQERGEKMSIDDACRRYEGEEGF